MSASIIYSAVEKEIKTDNLFNMDRSFIDSHESRPENDIQHNNHNKNCKRNKLNLTIDVNAEPSIDEVPRLQSTKSNSSSSASSTLSSSYISTSSYDSIYSNNNLTIEESCNCVNVEIENKNQFSTFSALKEDTPKKQSLLGRALSLSPRGNPTPDIDDDINKNQKFERNRRVKSMGQLNMEGMNFSNIDKRPKTARRNTSLTNYLTEFALEKKDHIENVKFQNCKHCEKVFCGSHESQEVNQRNGMHSRHLYCSGECYITRCALVQATLNKYKKR